ncbi:MAG: alanine racemase [Bacillota bacterium]
MSAKLLINLNKIKNNISFWQNLCQQNNIDLIGVGKGCPASPEVAELIGYHTSFYGDSRLNRLKSLKKSGSRFPLALLRIPALSEVIEVVKYTDVSFNSQLKVLDKLNQAACNLNKTHQIILMIEAGDLREGIYPPENAIKIAAEVENMSGLKLLGISSNFSCYGGIKPDINNLTGLIQTARKIETKINRKLEIISGGATTSLPLLLDKKLPARINQLRLGEALLLGRDIQEIWGYKLPELQTDSFILEAEVIEVETKPSKPYGDSYVDAFGQEPTFKDKGMRRRAILAVGRADLVYPDQLIPCNQGIEVLGASSDHLILDIENSKRSISVGNKLKFQLYYGPMLHLSQSNDVEKVIIK